MAGGGWRACLTTLPARKLTFTPSMFKAWGSCWAACWHVAPRVRARSVRANRRANLQQLVSRGDRAVACIIWQRTYTHGDLSIMLPGVFCQLFFQYSWLQVLTVQ